MHPFYLFKCIRFICLCAWLDVSERVCVRGGVFGPVMVEYVRMAMSAHAHATVIPVGPGKNVKHGTKTTPQTGPCAHDFIFLVSILVSKYSDSFKCQYE